MMLVKLHFEIHLLNVIDMECFTWNIAF